MVGTSDVSLPHQRGQEVGTLPHPPSPFRSLERQDEAPGNRKAPADWELHLVIRFYEQKINVLVTLV